MIIDISKLEKKLNLKFKNKKLLSQCLTHKSFNSVDNFEKLEFLGDRVLGLTIAKRLLEKYPHEKEGILDKKLASLVNKKKCFEVGKALNLEKYILTGVQKKKELKIENKIISDACEALIGAIFLDQGMIIAENFILKLWREHLNSSTNTFVDSKTKLQEYSLKIYKSLPIYKVIDNTGPKHKPIFKVAVRIKNTKFVNGIGNSKKEAEQNAAGLFLKSLGK